MTAAEDGVPAELAGAARRRCVPGSRALAADALPLLCRRCPRRCAGWRRSRPRAGPGSAARRSPPRSRPTTTSGERVADQVVAALPELSHGLGDGTVRGGRPRRRGGAGLADPAPRAGSRPVDDAVRRVAEAARPATRDASSSGSGRGLEAAEQALRDAAGGAQGPARRG